MIDFSVGQFVEKAFGGQYAGWDEKAVRELAGQSPPTALGGHAAWLTRGDAFLLWARWFLESLADPELYIDGTKKYPHLAREVLDSVSALASSMPPDERHALASSLSQTLWSEVQRRSIGRRVPADRETRLLLADLYPRCWICGAAFPEWARALFLRDDVYEEPSPLSYIDFMKPRGVRVEHMRIEIEHVVPRVSGGGDEIANLRLACRWCNSSKGGRTVLYDVEGQPRRFAHPTLGRVSVPQPFWVVRLLAMRGRCEHSEGCEATVSNSELTVAPIRAGGAANPSNLMVVCYRHDSLASTRRVARRHFRA